MDKYELIEGYEEWTPDLVKRMRNSWGGTLMQLANELSKESSDGKRVWPATIVEMADGNSANPTLLTMQKWADTFNQPIVIIPKGRKR